MNRKKYRQLFLERGLCYDFVMFPQACILIHINVVVVYIIRVVVQYLAMALVSDQRSIHLKENSEVKTKEYLLPIKYLLLSLTGLAWRS